MDENSGQNTDLLDPPEPKESGPSVGEKAGDAARGIKNAASTAKDVMGAIKGGAGDGLTGGGVGGGLGSTLGKGMGAIGGMGSSGNKSMDGMKGMGGALKAPNILGGKEGGNNPAPKNDTDSEKANPSAADFAKKVGGHAANSSSTGQKAKKAVDDTVKTAKDVQKGVRAFGGDAAAGAQLAAELASHPIEFTKRYGRMGLYLLLFFLLQTIFVVALFGVVFFGVYKVYLTGMEAIKNPTKIVTELRVNSEMASWLSGAVTQLTYERSLEEGGKPGVALAQENSGGSSATAAPTSPETEKMHQAWDKAGLAAKFMDDYDARIEPTGGSSGQTGKFDPTAWTLYVNNRNFGTLDSTKAKAYIGIFTEDTTHWNDIYTRSTLKSVAKNSFGVKSFKLDLPDSEKDISKSRENTTKQLVDTTLEPISTQSGTYYNCIISGGDACANLGLGKADPPSNSPSSGSYPGLLGAVVEAVLNIRTNLANQNLLDKINQDNLGVYVKSVGDEVTPDASTYQTKDSLDAAVRTGVSDTIFRNIGKSENGITPDIGGVLEMGKRTEEADKNGTLAATNYARASAQNAPLGFYYFSAGGQLLNNELGLLDSWALTENLSVLEESSSFRAAVLGSPGGVFAQSGDSTSDKECQQIYDDTKPVGEVKDNTDRSIKKASCLSKALILKPGEATQNKDIASVYSLLEKKNKQLDDSSGFGLAAAIKAIVKVLSPEKLDSYRNNQIRSSPVVADEVSIPEELSPDFDAYINQVYGVSRTGAEINGDLYDSMAMASEAMWAQAGVDDTVGIGGSYQSDQEVAKTVRYAQAIQKEKLALKPLSERLFSLHSPDSLAGKLALLTPTNRGDTAHKTLALFKPDSLSSAIASKFVPTSYAQASQPVNTYNAIRTGYSLGDSSNTMNGKELWDTYNCASGGITQEKTSPEGVPFDIYANTNPCKRETVISKMTTCWFDTEDSCGFGNSTPGASNTSSTGTVGDIGESSDGVPCAEGSKEIGDVESRYTASLKKSSPLIIKLCQVPDIGGRGNDTSGNNIEGGIVVNSRVSGAWVALGRAAKEAGIKLSGSSFRLADSCGGTGSGTACAKPGTSMHQLGIAVDFSGMGTKGGSTSSCSGRQGAPNDPRWVWLFDNAEKNGIKQYSYEPWHWDTGGFANRCDSSQRAINQPKEAQ